MVQPLLVLLRPVGRNAGHGRKVEDLPFEQAGSDSLLSVSCAEPIPYKHPIVIQQVLPEGIVEGRKQLSISRL